MLDSPGTPGHSSSVPPPTSSHASSACSVTPARCRSARGYYETWTEGSSSTAGVLTDGMTPCATNVVNQVPRRPYRPVASAAMFDGMSALLYRYTSSDVSSTTTPLHPSTHMPDLTVSWACVRNSARKSRDLPGYKRCLSSPAPGLANCCIQLHGSTAQPKHRKASSVVVPELKHHGKARSINTD